jgi:uncharacterized membrane protein
MEVDLWSFNRTDKLVSGQVNWWITNKNGKVSEGNFGVIIESDSAEKQKKVTWNIPDDASGFHSFFCTLTDDSGNLLFVNDYYFDVGAPEAPGILWVKVVDKDDKPISGANVEIDGFTRTTDVFGRVPFLLNTGKYKVKADVNGKIQEVETDAEIGKTTEVVVKYGGS